MRAGLFQPGYNTIIFVKGNDPHLLVESSSWVGLGQALIAVHIMCLFSKNSLDMRLLACLHDNTEVCL